VERVASLFAPFNIRGKLPLRNRIVLAPLYLAWDGRSAEFRAFYVRRAEGGVGLVIAPQSTPGGRDARFGPAGFPRRARPCTGV